MLSYKIPIYQVKKNDNKTEYDSTTYMLYMMDKTPVIRYKDYININRNEFISYDINKMPLYKYDEFDLYKKPKENIDEIPELVHLDDNNNSDDDGGIIKNVKRIFSNIKSYFY